MAGQSHPDRSEQAAPDTWVPPNMIFQVGPIPVIGEPEEQLGVPAQKSNQNPDRSEEQMGLQATKSNQDTKDEPVGKSNQRESYQPESTKSRCTEKV